MDQNKKNPDRNRKFLYTLVMVLLWSVVFGVAMHSLVMGVCLGVAMGAVFGLYGSEDKEKKKQKEEPQENGEAAQDDSGE